MGTHVSAPPKPTANARADHARKREKKNSVCHSPRENRLNAHQWTPRDRGPMLLTTVCRFYLRDKSSMCPFQLAILHCHNRAFLNILIRPSFRDSRSIFISISTAAVFWASCELSMCHVPSNLARLRILVASYDIGEASMAQSMHAKCFSKTKTKAGIVSSRIYILLCFYTEVIK